MNHVGEHPGEDCQSNCSKTVVVAVRGTMRKAEKTVSWVVYRMTMRVKGQTTGMGAVCEQGEWEAMERAQPGHHTLIRAGITNEGEAERLARSIETVSIEQAGH
jgi:hypothetical protein